MLVTKNVIDRLAFQFTMKDLSLQEKLTSVLSVDDALKNIQDQHKDLTRTNEGYAMVLLDLEDNSNAGMIRNQVKNLRQSMRDKKLSYTPKIVLFSCVKKTSKKQSYLKSLGVDYQLCKPIRMQDFIKMCGYLKYDFKSYI